MQWSSGDGAAAGAGLEGDSGSDQAAPGDGSVESGIETGLRVGWGVPLGKAGESQRGTERELRDLTPWRAPLWLDVGYRISPQTTLGGYLQLGVGESGDACEGECDWSDIRVGLHGQFRLAAPSSPIQPWVGAGLGYEWLSFRTLAPVSVMDPESGELIDVPVRTAEQLGGPELLAQLGLDFRVEDSLVIGPYLSATLGQYLTDGYKCRPNISCTQENALEGSGFHSWLGIGLRGSYLP